MSITPFPTQGQYPWYDQLEQWGADTQAAAESAELNADGLRADVATALADSTAASAAAIAAAGLVDAPAGAAVLAAISEGGEAREALEEVAANRAVSVQSNSSMSTWFGKLKKVREGTGSAKIVFVGDSTTIGVGADLATSYPSHLLARLGADRPARRGLSVYSVFPGLTQFSLNTGWHASAAGATGSAPMGLAQSAIFGEKNAEGYLYFKPEIICNRVDVWLWHAPDMGTVGIGVNGGVTITADCAAGAGWTKHTINVSMTATDSVTLAPPTIGPVYVMGAEAYTDGAKEVIVSNLGVAGASTISWTNAWGGAQSLSGLKAYAPDLTVIMLGINDAGQPVSNENYATYMGDLVDAAKVSGDVVLCSVFPSDPMTKSAQLAREKGYIPVLQSIARAKGCAFIDVLTAFNGYDTFRYSDTLHPNSAGYVEGARIILSGLFDI